MTVALVVDDEHDLADLVASYLRAEGFDARQVHDGPTAVTLARELDPEVVVLDLGLPGLDGIEVCRAIRRFSDCYIVMLTARADEIDRLIGLTIGADDYLTKPFSPRELIVRIRVLQRRPRPSQAGTRLEFGDLRLDLAARRVTLAGEPVDLTRTEFDLLALLARDPGTVHGRTELLQALWGADWVGDDHAAEVHVGHIRAKLGPRGREFVKTVRGVGYQIGDGT